MKHVMIDIEVMDNKPTAAITSIAAAIFDPMSGQLSDNLKSLAAKGALGAAL